MVKKNTYFQPAKLFFTIQINLCQSQEHLTCLKGTTKNIQK